jgi:PTS system N-acetylglucosamine-specific IIC component
VYLQVHNSSLLTDDAFTLLGAKVVIRPDKHTIQVVLGTKAESVAEKIKTFLPYS